MDKDLDRRLITSEAGREFKELCLQRGSQEFYEAQLELIDFLITPGKHIISEKESPDVYALVETYKASVYERLNMPYDAPPCVAEMKKKILGLGTR
jgi:hypothetical protein